MIKTIVPIYPNESVFSWLSRIFIRSGIGVKSKFLSEIYKGRSYPDLIFVGGLSDFFINELKKVVSLKELETGHTLLKYYLRFLNLDRRKKVYEKAIQNNKGIQNLLPVEMGKEDYYLRYCPCCVSEDRKKYGESYFHVEHLIPNVRICVKHGCRLIDSNIKVVDYRSSNFVPLEQVVDDLSIVKINQKSIEYIVAKYIIDIFKEDIDFKNDRTIGKYLSNNLSGKYIRETTGQRNNELIVSDLKKYYKDLKNYEMGLNKLQSILCGHSWNSYEISLLALFEGLSVKELVNYKDLNIKKEVINWNKLDEQFTNEFKKMVKDYCEIDKTKINKKWLSKTFGFPPLMIRDHMPRLIKSLSEFKGKKINWYIVDKECCLKLNKMLKDDPLMLDKDEVTQATICKILGVSLTSLRHLPQLMSMIYKLKPDYKNKYQILDSEYCKRFTNEYEGRLNIESVAVCFNISDRHLRNYPELRFLIKERRIKAKLNEGFKKDQVGPI